MKAELPAVSPPETSSGALDASTMTSCPPNRCGDCITDSMRSAGVRPANQTNVPSAPGGAPAFNHSAEVGGGTKNALRAGGPRAGLDKCLPWLHAQTGKVRPPADCAFRPIRRPVPVEGGHPFRRQAGHRFRSGSLGGDRAQG